MAITLEELRCSGEPIEAIVHSIEGSIYRLSVVVNGREMRVLDEDGKTFQRRSVSHVREGLKKITIAKMTLRQQSAYDEMIGHAAKSQANTLEVPQCVKRDDI